MIDNHKRKAHEGFYKVFFNEEPIEYERTQDEYEKRPDEFYKIVEVDRRRLDFFPLNFPLNLYDPREDQTEEGDQKDIMKEWVK